MKEMTFNLKNKNLKPVTKWVGGKRQLLSALYQYLPQKFNRYYEPFVGGGALLFSLAPEKAVINDANTELMNVYRVIKQQPPALTDVLSKMARYNSKDFYLQVRALDRSKVYDLLTPVQRAARLLYMLRVDYNGMYRVNSQNQFNVPYGRQQKSAIVNSENIMAVHDYFANNDIELLSGDFALAVADAQAGDLVYFDPPYVPLNPTSSFTSYTKDDFGDQEQRRLAQWFSDLDQKGVYVILSNSDTDYVRDLYQEFNIHIVQASRSVNANGQHRGKVNEVIVTNY